MKRYRVVYDISALDDLKEISKHICETSNEVSALAYIERVETFCSHFDKMPERFPAWRPEYLELRIATLKRALTIAYEIQRDKVVILRVLAKGRNAAKQFPELK